MYTYLLQTGVYRVIRRRPVWYCRVFNIQTSLRSRTCVCLLTTDRSAASVHVIGILDICTCAVDPALVHAVHLAVLALAHFDGFAPRAQRPDYFIVDYLLLRPIVGPTHACLQGLVKPWVIWDGPKPVLSLEPIVGILKAQLTECLKDGVMVPWLVGARPTAGSWVAPKAGDLVHVTFTVGAFAGDQPATQTFNGHMSHNGVMGCRRGSISKKCMGSTLSRDLKDALFDSSHLLCLVKKKGVDIPDKKKVTWHRHTREEMTRQASVAPTPESVRAAQEAAGLGLVAYG
jgi:hypothetical protein